MKFINRHFELEYLNKTHSKKQAQLIVVYGKRRVGKTELIKQFIKNKESVYYLLDKRPEKEQLFELAKRIGDHFNDPLLKRAGFASWLELFEYLKRSANKNFILAIDEFPYAIENNKAVPSLFQKGWDEHLKDSSVFLILTGSSISMMESLLGYKAPLYGRRTGQLLIQPLNFYQARQFFPTKSFEEFIQIFAILGGMPAYLLQLDANLSLKENISKKILDIDSVLFREIPFMVREEFREPRNYLSILHAIAYNKTKFGEIVSETGLERAVLYKYLGVLEDLQIIKKMIPVTVKYPHKFRRTTYRLQENFVKFWFTFIDPFRSELELHNKSQSLKKFDKAFPAIVSQAYEDILGEIVRKHQDMVFPFQQVGQWWTDSAQIDLVCVNQEEKKVLFGEAKWSDKPVGINVFKKLKETSLLVGEYKDFEQKYALFSKSGFTPEMKEVAKKESVYLFQKDILQEI